jgi:hypothetical protein
MQIFPRSLNKLPAVIAAAATFGVVALTGLIWYYFSPWYTLVGYSPRQPVPYSHRLHAGQLGLDCRYCHANVERAPMAMVPPTETCMNCHQLVKTDSKLLEPIRNSWETHEPMQWIRVHKLPDYVYFDHSVHVTAGVGCAECHGLECHRDVRDKGGDSAFIRPVAQMTNMAFIHDKHVDPPRPLNPPENCNGCHR